MMVLNEKELEVCLKYALFPILKQYDMSVKETDLSIDDKIHVRAVITYQTHTLDVIANFCLNYQNCCLCFQNIEGKIEYVFLQMNLLNTLQQMIHLPQVTFDTHNCYVQIDLPIQDIVLKENLIDIQLKS